MRPSLLIWDHVDRRSNKSTSSCESTQRSRGQKIIIESWTHWGYLIFQTGTRGKMNQLFPRPSDGGNHRGLGSWSIFRINNFAELPKCDTLFDRVRLRNVLYWLCQQKASHLACSDRLKLVFIRAWPPYHEILIRLGLGCLKMGFGHEISAKELLKS